MSELAVQRVLDCNDDDLGGFDKSEFFADNIVDYSVGLGANAVDNTIIMAYHEIQGLEDAGLTADTKSEIRDVRKYIENLSIANKKRLNKYLAGHKQSPTLDRILDVKDVNWSGNKEYIGRLLERNKDMTWAVSNDQFINFLQWHNYNIQLANHRMMMHFDAQKEVFMCELQGAIDKGWVPEWVMEIAEGRFDNLAVVMDEGRGTYMLGVMATAIVHEGNQSEIVVDPYYPPSKYRELFLHELLHVCEGITDTDDICCTSGLKKLFEDPSEYGPRAINEATIEHLSDAMHKGNSVDVINPYKSERKDAVYEIERDLLYILTTMGTRPIDIREFIGVLFDDGEFDNENGQTPTEVLKQSLKEAFPSIDVIECIEEVRDRKELESLVKYLRKNAPNKKHMSPAEFLDRHETTKDVGKGVLIALGLVASAATAIHLFANSSSADVKSPQESLRNDYSTSQNTTGN